MLEAGTANRKCKKAQGCANSAEPLAHSEGLGVG